MRICTFLGLTLLTILFYFNSLAQTTYTSINDGDWTTPGIWSPSAPGTIINAGDSVIINNDVAMNQDLVVRGTLIINQDAQLESTTRDITELTGDIINNGTFEVRLIANINGNFINNVKFDASDALYVAPAGSFSNGVFGFATVNSIIVGGTFVNTGNVFADAGGFNVIGTGNVTNSWIIRVDGDLNVASGASINNVGGIFHIGGEESVNNGTITGGYFNFCGGGDVDFNNEGTLAGEMEICMCSTNEDNDFENDGSVGPDVNINTNCVGLSLPVEFITVSAKYDFTTGMVKVNWSTASEENNDFFTIERSTDGLTFEALGSINGAGSSETINSYVFEDDNPVEGVSYYRIKQTDFNGQFDYSEVVTAEVQTMLDMVSVYPNPVTGSYISAAIQHNIDQVGYVITNITGQVVKSGQLDSLTGSKIDLNELNAGMYFITFDAAGNKETKSIIIQ